MQEEKFLLNLIANVINNQLLPPIDEQVDLNLVYEISARHYVTGLAYHAIINYPQGLINQEIINKFKKKFQKDVIREANQQSQVETILNRFEANQIDALPLKGYVIKHIYPSVEMRIMSDIDILVKKEKLKLAGKILKEEGFILLEKGVNHDVYQKLPFVNLELHQDLVVSDSPYYLYLKDVWNQVEVDENKKHVYHFKLEELYIYLLIHLAKHYGHAGTGIRYIIDLFLFNKKYIDVIDDKSLDAKLEKLNLKVFNDNIKAIGEMWFNHGKEDELTKEMSAFILDSGVYGSRKNYILTEMSTKKKHSKKTYLMELFFPPLEKMKTRFPILKKLIILLPFAYIYRLIWGLFCRKKTANEILSNLNQVSLDEVKGMKAFMKKSGLQ